MIIFHSISLSCKRMSSLRAIKFNHFFADLHVLSEGSILPTIGKMLEFTSGMFFFVTTMKSEVTSMFMHADNDV